MARKPAAQANADALDKALRGLFRMLEQRPVPGRLMSIVDQLEEAVEPLRKSG